jgi:hypothetical protein
MKLQEWIEKRKAELKASCAGKIYLDGKKDILKEIESALAYGEIETGVQWIRVEDEKPKESVYSFLAKIMTDFGYVIEMCVFSEGEFFRMDNAEKVNPTHWASINLPKEDK